MLCKYTWLKLVESYFGLLLIPSNKELDICLHLPRKEFPQYMMIIPITSFINTKHSYLYASL